MPRIPVYEQRTAPNSLGVTPRAQPVQVENISRGLADLGTGLGALAGEMLDQNRRQVEDRAAAESANLLSKGEAYWHEQFNERSKGWKPGDPDLREGLNKDFEKWTEETASALPTDKARQFFQRNALSIRTRMDKQAYDLQERRNFEAVAASTDEGMNADYDTIYRNPGVRAEVIARRSAAILAMESIPIDKRQQIVRAFQIKANQAAESAELERDPTGYRARRFANAPSTSGASATAPADPTATPTAPATPGTPATTSGAATAPATTAEAGTPAPSVVIPPGARVPAGMRNNNPTNIKYVGQKDSIGPSENLDQGDPQARYASHEDGLAAGYRLALRKYDGGKKSLNQLIAGQGGWTPGNTAAAANIARMMGISPDDDLNLRSPEALQKFGRALIRQEQGESAKYYSDGMLQSVAAAVLSGQPVRAGASSTSGPSVSGAPAAGPGGVVELPGAPDSFKSLPWDVREKLRIEVDGRIRQQTAVAAQALTTRVQDATAMARDGIADPQPLTRDHFAPLGDRADAAFKEYQNTQILASDVASFQGSSNADLNAVASGSARRAVPGEGYAAEDQRDLVRSQAAAAVLKQRKDDPAGYVLRTVPTARDALKAAIDPSVSPEARAAATQRVAAETIAAQRTLGIADPQVLSKAAVEDLGKRISKASRPEDAANLIGALEAEYGPAYFPQVMNELMKAEKLTPALMIIPNLPSASARELVSALAVVKMDDLKTGINLDDQKRVREQAVEHAATLARTFPPISGSGYVLLNSYQDMIEKIAYERLRTGQDKNGAVAAESAYKTLLGHFEFNGTMRLPKGVDGSAVKKRLDRELSKAVPDSLTQGDVPENLSRAYKPEESLALWRDTVQSKAVWYTNKENTGVDLWARGANGELYRVKKDGQQISYPFDKLTAVETPSPNMSNNEDREYLEKYGAVGAMGRSFINNGDRPVQRGR